MSFLATLRALPLSRQIMLGGVLAAVVLAMSMMGRIAMQQPMALLYSGLDAEHTGEIIEELEQRGTKYEIQGDAIFVQSGDRDSVRFALARQGLPRQSVKGYELLDEVNGFSVTSEMYNAAYWRAKEGELTRTILTIPGIKEARVHIGASLRSGFARTEPTQTASVTISSAYDLNTSQAQGIQYMVALAVAGMQPEEVAVIDLRKGILAGPGIEKADQPAIQAETQEEALEQKVLRLLEARVGAGNARVSVSVDVSHQRQKVSSVAFDPDSRVVRNRTTGDVSEQSGGTSNNLSAASNLPQGANGGSTTNSTTRNSSESVSYEINETRTETESLPGQVERISIAVLVNQDVLGIDPAAADAAQQSETMVSNLRQLVMSAAGLDSSRGDDLTVEVMPFQLPEASQELIAAPSMMETMMERYMWSGIKIFVLALVVIVLALGVLRPILTRGPATAGAGAGGDGLDGDSNADPFVSLKDYTAERQDEAAAILAEWLNEDRKVAVNE
ncbi:MAG: flagellar M-ring protein FliF [Hyphomonas sp.]|nr:flagellar M-ring protein FliF [Hyphomonas sp.]